MDNFDWHKYKKVMVLSALVILAFVTILAVYVYNSTQNREGNTPVVSYAEESPVSSSFKDTDCTLREYTNANAPKFKFKYNDCDFTLSEQSITSNDYNGGTLQNYNVTLSNKAGFKLSVDLIVPLDGYPAFVCLDNMKSEYKEVNDLTRFYYVEQWRYFKLYEPHPLYLETEEKWRGYKNYIQILSYPVETRAQFTSERCYDFHAPMTETVFKASGRDGNYNYSVNISYQNADYSDLVDSIVETMEF